MRPGQCAVRWRARRVVLVLLSDPPADHPRQADSDEAPLRDRVQAVIFAYESRLTRTGPKQAA
jgi:hypothetical protein